MDDFRFSLLISVYKAENPLYLQECLDSIFLSSLIPAEIVIVEDGPLTDSLYKVLEKYETDSNTIIKRIPLPNNVGLGQALAIGLQECSFNIVGRMDTDDICMFNRFELQIKEFQKDEDLVLVGSYIDEFDDDSQKVRSTRKVPLKQADILKYAKKRNPFNHMTVMYNKNKVLEVGNYRKVLDIGYEDYDLWVRMLNAGHKVKNLDSSTVKVRTGESMLKRRGNKKRLKTALYFRKQMLKIGYINIFEYYFYSLITVLFSFSPIILKGYIYKSILRR